MEVVLDSERDQIPSEYCIYLEINR